jgi:hypothetical protein
MFKRNDFRKNPSFGRDFHRGVLPLVQQPELDESIETQPCIHSYIKKRICGLRRNRQREFRLLIGTINKVLDNGKSYFGRRAG